MQVMPIKTTTVKQNLDDEFQGIFHTFNDLFFALPVLSKEFKAQLGVVVFKKANIGRNTI